MDCRTFREKHVGFVDDTLAAIDMDAMRRHARQCPACAKHDTSIRRSLLIVRNVPTIEPSPDFMARLNERLRELGPLEASPRLHRPSLGAFSALAAGIALAAYVALEAMHMSTPAPIRMAPVVATAPEVVPPAITSPAFMASASTGMAIWPTLMTLEQGPMHQATLEAEQTSLAP